MKTAEDGPDATSLDPDEKTGDVDTADDPEPNVAKAAALGRVR